ncbi:hypothetical protein AYO52_17065 [Dietzia sp. 111N12-1]|nr:hypothetical protein AYO52_17065 [Dietzia sp. 111N12-1]
MVAGLPLQPTICQDPPAHDERTDEMFPAGSIENPLRFLFGPGPDEPACLALTPECMGLIPYLASRFGIPS